MACAVIGIVFVTVAVVEIFFVVACTFVESFFFMACVVIEMFALLNVFIVDVALSSGVAESVVVCDGVLVRA